MNVFVVLKNADAEGRGPMVLDKVFKNEGHADTYVATDPHMRQVREVEVFEYDVVAKKELDRRATIKLLDTLTADEKRLLTNYFGASDNV